MRIDWLRLFDRAVGQRPALTSLTSKSRIDTVGLIKEHFLRPLVPVGWLRLLVVSTRIAPEAEMRGAF